MMARTGLFTPFPTLTTMRLTLRALRPDDLDDLWAYASDPAIDRYTPWVHYHTRAEAAADLQRYLGQYTAGELGVWGIEHRAEGRLIGICNFAAWHPTHRRAELGYTIARAAWGHGYATEAAGAVIAFGFSHMDLRRVEALCLPDNAGSVRVLQKLGMQCEGLLRCYEVWQGQSRDLKLYAIVRSEDAPADC